MKHSEFIEKMAMYAVADTYENFRKRHADDPQIPSLGDETHRRVCKLAKLIDLSSPGAMRVNLIAKCRAEPPNGKLNSTRRDVGKAILIRVMIASGLKWFELDGCPYIHWGEKP